MPEPLVPCGPFEPFEPTFVSYAREHLAYEVCREPPARRFVYVASAPLHWMVNWRSLKALLTDERAQQRLRRDALLLIDESTEGSPFKRSVFDYLHRRLGKAGIDPGRVIYLTQNRRLPGDYAAWRGGPGVQIAVWHYFLRQSFHAARALPAAVGRPRPAARFLMLNHGLRPHRVAAVGRIMRLGLMERGLVSVLHWAYAESAEPTFEEALARALAEFPRWEDDITAFAGLRDHLPLWLPEDRARSGLPARQGLHALQTDFAPELHARAGFSLLAETEMSDGRVRRFTEKILKPLACGLPMVVAGNPGALADLRDHGFSTFAPWIDEGYDDLNDPQERLEAVMDEFARLCAMDEVSFERMLAELAPVLNHNRRALGQPLADRLSGEDAALAETLSAMFARTSGEAASPPAAP